MIDHPRTKITDVRSVQLRLIEDIGTLEPAWDVGGTLTFRRGGTSIIEVHTDSRASSSASSSPLLCSSVALSSVASSVKASVVALLAYCVPS